MFIDARMIIFNGEGIQGIGAGKAKRGGGVDGVFLANRTFNR
jgi:hypothetical protein